MRKKIPRFSKFWVSIFIAFFALLSIPLGGNHLILKPSIAEAANSTNGLAIDNPGIRRAIEVQERNTERLMDIPGVVGHGVGISSDGSPVIKIFVERAGIPGIPEFLESIPTKVNVTGMVIAYIDPTGGFSRPVPIGVSTGHPDITAGTIGCRVTDGSNVYALSNNHVYANENQAAIEDEVLQPAPYDGGGYPDDVIGRLADFEPIDFSGVDNQMDAAIASLSIDELGVSTPGVAGDDGYGVPSSTIVENPGPGLTVQKYGRATAWTQGSIDTVNTIVDVCYESKGIIFPRCTKEARFTGQIAITPGDFSAGGDSGSLIVTADSNKNPVALLFAGSSTHTFANPIGLVLERFNVTIDSGGPIADSTDIAIAAVDAPGSVLESDQVDVNVTVQNMGNQAVDSFNVILTDLTDNMLVGTQNIPSLAVGSFTTLSFPWDTTSAFLGDHTLEAGHNLSDENSANDTETKIVTVNEASQITLTATGYKIRGRQYADLEWSGASSDPLDMVDIYRDGLLLVTTENDGFYIDNINNLGGGSYTYKVCESGSDPPVCSNEATVTY